jgi:RecJ-like exonuclease
MPTTKEEKKICEDIIRAIEKYESPISLSYEDIMKDIVERQEGYIVECVHKVGVDVNKEELVKALSYDRDQYNKGYADRDAEIVRCKDCKKYIPCRKLPIGTSKWCDLFDRATCEMNYCGWAERKEDELLVTDKD